MDLFKNEKNHEDIKNKIIEASKWLFVNNGFKETSMTSIAYKARIRKKTLYNYFASKEEIVVAIENNVFEEFINHMNKSLENIHGNGYKKLEKYFDLVSKCISKFEDFFYVISFRNENVETNNFKQICKYIEEISGFLIGILEEGMWDESIISHIDPIITSKTITDSWLFLLQKHALNKDMEDEQLNIILRKEIECQLYLFKLSLKNNSNN